MVKVKICGITNLNDALGSAGSGCDALGFVFYKKSPRYIDPAKAKNISRILPKKILRMGVFVDEKEKEVKKIAKLCELDILQFHGDESPEYCARFKDDYKVIKAFRVKDSDSLKSVNDYGVDYYLFDTYKSDSMGGTGEKFDWKILKDFEILKPFILSGGLDPENVERAIREVAPYAVDVSSGVESAPGKKDPELLKRFIENVRMTQ